MKRPLQLLLCLTAILMTVCAGGPDHDDEVDTADCGTCHELPPADRFHTTHYGKKQYDCGVCHTGASLMPPRNKSARHNNGTVDVEFTSPFESWFSFFSYYDTTAKSCEGIYCHRSLSPPVKVRDTANPPGCNSCHDLRTSFPSFHGGIGIPDSIAKEANCSRCHEPGYRLRLLFYDHHLILPDSISKKSMVPPDRTASNCSQCHSGFSDSTVNEPLHVNGRLDLHNCNECHEPVAWGSYDKPELKCAACHDSAQLMKSKHHSTPDTATVQSWGCTTCHPVLKVQGVNTVLHFNGEINVQHCDSCHTARVWETP